MKKTNYKIYLNAIICNRFYSNFIKKFDLGIDEYGQNVEICLTTDTEPTQKIIDNIIKGLSKSKDEKNLDEYYSNIKFNRVEVYYE